MSHPGHWYVVLPNQREWGLACYVSYVVYDSLDSDHQSRPCVVFSGGMSRHGQYLESGQ